VPTRNVHELTRICNTADMPARIYDGADDLWTGTELRFCPQRAKVKAHDPMPRRGRPCSHRRNSCGFEFLSMVQPYGMNRLYIARCNQSSSIRMMAATFRLSAGTPANCVRGTSIPIAGRGCKLAHRGRKCRRPPAPTCGWPRRFGGCNTHLLIGLSVVWASTVRVRNACHP
jgi:hypothetical protein